MQSRIRKNQRIRNVRIIRRRLRVSIAVLFLISLSYLIKLYTSQIYFSFISMHFFDSISSLMLTKEIGGNYIFLRRSRRVFLQTGVISF